MSAAISTEAHHVCSSLHGLRPFHCPAESLSFNLIEVWAAPPQDQIESEWPLRSVGGREEGERKRNAVVLCHVACLGGHFRRRGREAYIPTAMAAVTSEERNDLARGGGGSAGEGERQIPLNAHSTEPRARSSRRLRAWGKGGEEEAACEQ